MKTRGKNLYRTNHNTGGPHRIDKEEKYRNSVSRFPGPESGAGGREGTNRRKEGKGKSRGKIRKGEGPFPI